MRNEISSGLHLTSKTWATAEPQIAADLLNSGGVQQVEFFSVSNRSCNRNSFSVLHDCPRGVFFITSE